MVEADQPQRKNEQVVLTRISHEATILLPDSTDEVVNVKASVFKHIVIIIIAAERVGESNTD